MSSGGRGRSAPRSASRSAPRSALSEYRDDGPLVTVLAPLITGARDRLGSSRLPDSASLTVAGLVPVAVGAMLPGGSPPLGGGLAWLVLCAGAGAGRQPAGRLEWLVPPMLRAGEYGILLRLAASDAGRVAQCYPLLAAVAFHHYDVVYRLRARGIAPPRWLRFAGGGWEGRLLVAYWLARTGRLAPGLRLSAALLGSLFVAESVRSWLPERPPGALAAGTRSPAAAHSAAGGAPQDTGLYDDEEADEE